MTTPNNTQTAPAMPGCAHTNCSGSSELEWSNPEMCSGSHIQQAQPAPEVRYYILRPQGDKCGDKWSATISVGTQYKRSKMLHDREETELAAKKRCQDHWAEFRGQNETSPSVGANEKAKS